MLALERRSKMRSRQSDPPLSEVDVMKRVVTETLNVLETVSALSRELLGDGGMDELNLAYAVIKKVLQQAQNASPHIDGVITLYIRLVDLWSVLEDACSRVGPEGQPIRMQRRLGRLATKLIIIGASLNLCPTRSILLPFRTAKADTTWLANVVTKVYTALEEFFMEGMSLPPARMHTPYQHMALEEDGIDSETSSVHTAESDETVVEETLALPDTRPFWILGAIAFAQQPLSPAALAGLLGYHEDDIIRTMEEMHSTLYVPRGTSSCIGVVGPDPLSSTINFHGPEQHQMLLRCCLESLTVLGPVPAATFNDIILRLREKVANGVPPHIPYACRHWAAHLVGSIGDAAAEDVFEPLRDFIQRQLPYWFALCVLLGLSKEAMSTLATAIRACETLGEPFPDLALRIIRCRRFGYSLHQAALARLTTRKPLTPAHNPNCELSLIIGGTALPRWNHCLEAFAKHGLVDLPSVSSSHRATFTITGSRESVARFWSSFSAAVVPGEPTGIHDLSPWEFLAASPTRVGPQWVYAVALFYEGGVLVVEWMYKEARYIVGGSSRQKRSVKSAADTSDDISAVAEPKDNATDAKTPQIIQAAPQPAIQVIPSPDDDRVSTQQANRTTEVVPISASEPTHTTRSLSHSHSFASLDFSTDDTGMLVRGDNDSTRYLLVWNPAEHTRRSPSPSRKGYPSPRDSGFTEGRMIAV